MKLIAAALIGGSVLAAAATHAQNPASPSTASPQTNNPPGDHPGLGEIRTLQQLRHIKLWFAGHAGNWPLADYELGELGEGFEDVNNLLGGDTVDTMVGGPLKDLQKAISDKNSSAFTVAFDGLSAGCNNCHHALDHAFIVIKRPTLLPYSDQSFEPQK